MKYKLPILASILLLLYVHNAWTQPPANTPSEDAGRPGKVALTNQDNLVTPDAGAVGGATRSTNPSAAVNEAIRLLASHPNLSLRLRFRVELWGQSLAGTGVYLQRWHGGKLHYRYDLRFTLGGQSRSMQYVADGRFLWIRKNLPGIQSLGRIDLRRLAEHQLRTADEQAPTALPWELVPFVRQAVSDGLPVPAGDQLPPHLVLPTFATSGRAQGSGDTQSQVAKGRFLGGFLALVDSLHRQFNFEQIESLKWGKQRLPVQRIVGRWRNLDEQAELPHLPSRVEVILANDQQQPLFPYRVKLSRKTDEDRWLTLFQIDVLEANTRATLPMDRFVFQAGDKAAVEDITFDADALFPWTQTL